MSTEERVARLEQAFVSLLDLVRGADERADTHMGWINQLGAAQAESERKIAALVDAQIRTEDALRGLADEQARTQAAVRELAAQVGALAAAQQQSAEEAAELRRAFSTVARLAEEMDARLQAVEGRGGG